MSGKVTHRMLGEKVMESHGFKESFENPLFSHTVVSKNWH